MAGAQDESWDLRPELRSIGRNKIVVALHEAFAGLEDAEALVLVNATRLYRRLLTDDSLALHLDVLARGIMNEPAPRDELSDAFSDILDANEIGEHVMLLRRLGLIAQVHRANGDADTGSFFVEEWGIAYLARWDHRQRNRSQSTLRQKSSATNFFFHLS